MYAQHRKIESQIICLGTIKPKDSQDRQWSPMIDGGHFSFDKTLDI
jgi:hypothetical protein